MRLSLTLLCLLSLAAHADEAPPEPPVAPANPVQMAPTPHATMTLPTPIDYGVLTVSRERLEVSTPCDIGLYLQGNLTARLYQGQSVTLNLPPGEIQVRLGQLGGGGCQPRFEQLRSQTLRITVGEVQKYRIAMDNQGIRLIPAPLNY
ncbi:hypothetical protein [Pseudomonas sp. GOM6]|uniref:hypothetical protein n=1 Tax=Pseudomonas sp. GOM6 TaxID=3036944 RepID=UPI00240A0FE2|nr:hypothetical protein [Pseudomonas sp. GOM6]MDG1581451.1 hypothetical protein [Pseudomonas sp. GOM6]